MPSHRTAARVVRAQAAESASPEKRAAIRGKWQAALAKVKQAKAVAQPDSVLGPRDIAGAVSLSKFARLLPKWGCAHMLAGTVRMVPCEEALARRLLARC